MYKCKLQEFCQRRGWNLPEYSTARDGPDHIPRFTAVVNVNGQPFQTPNQCKSSKEAQNLVAQIAYHHFVAQSFPSGQHQHYQPSSSSAHPGAQAVFPIPTWNGPPRAAPVPAVMPSSTVPVSEVPPIVPVLPVSAPKLLLEASIPPPPMPPARFFTAKTNSDAQPANKEIMQSNYEDNAQTSMINLDNQPANKEIMQMSYEDNAQTSMANTSPMVSNDKSSKDVLHIYKNRLQQYAQKKSLSLPVYTSESEGPPHARRFKSGVSLDGKIYEAPAFFPTLKDAEHAAAKVACQALSIVEILEDKGLYKNLLQGLAQKRGLKYPSYETSPAGLPHKPVFVSTVEIGSDTFQGTEAKTKKQAEINAAEVAYIALSESSPVKEALEVSSSMGSTAATELKVNLQPTPIVKDENDAENEEGKINAKRPKTSSENVSADLTGPSTNNSPPPRAPSLCTSRSVVIEPVTEQSDEHSVVIEPVTEQSVEHSVVIEPVTEQSVEHSVVIEPVEHSPRMKTVVFPRSTNMPIPDGAIVKSYSDDQWVAYKVEMNQ